jgi:hypothetical protein
MALNCELKKSNPLLARYSGRNRRISIQAKELNYRNTISSKLSLSLQLYGIMLKTGYVKVTSNMTIIHISFGKEIWFRENWFYNANLWQFFWYKIFFPVINILKWVTLFYDNQYDLFKSCIS